VLHAQLPANTSQALTARDDQLSAELLRREQVFCLKKRLGFLPRLTESPEAINNSSDQQDKSLTGPGRGTSEVLHKSGSTQRLTAPAPHQPPARSKPLPQLTPRTLLTKPRALLTKPRTLLTKPTRRVWPGSSYLPGTLCASVAPFPCFTDIPLCSSTLCNEHMGLNKSSDCVSATSIALI